VFLALVVQYAMRMRHIIICGLSRSTIILQIVLYKQDFRKKKYWTQIACFDFLYNFYLKNFSFYE
jgi:hypothetical protein